MLYMRFNISIQRVLCASNFDERETILAAIVGKRLRPYSGPVAKRLGQKRVILTHRRISEYENPECLFPLQFTDYQDTVICADRCQRWAFRFHPMYSQVPQSIAVTVS